MSTTHNDQLGGACKHPGESHSEGVVTVWHGSSIPLTLCPYHASRLDSRMFAELYSAGILPQTITL